jgi:hypothetical protein
MEGIISANKEHVESRKIQNKILKWDDLAKLDSFQLEVINQIEELSTKSNSNVNKINFVVNGINEILFKEESEAKTVEGNDESAADKPVESTPKFLTLYDQIDDLFLNQFDDVYLEFYNQLENRTKECDELLGEVNSRLNFDLFTFKTFLKTSRSTTASTHSTSSRRNTILSTQRRRHSTPPARTSFRSKANSI